MSGPVKSPLEIVRTLWKTSRIECHLVRADGKMRVLEIVDRKAWDGTKADAVIKLLAQHDFACPVIDMRRTSDKIRVQSRLAGRLLSGIRHLPVEEADGVAEDLLNVVRDLHTLDLCHGFVGPAAFAYNKDMDRDAESSIRLIGPATIAFHAAGLGDGHETAVAARACGAPELHTGHPPDRTTDVYAVGRTLRMVDESHAAHGTSPWVVQMANLLDVHSRKSRPESMTDPRLERSSSLVPFLVGAVVATVLCAGLYFFAFAGGSKNGSGTAAGPEPSAVAAGEMPKPTVAEPQAVGSPAAKAEPSGPAPAPGASAAGAAPQHAVPDPVNVASVPAGTRNAATQEPATQAFPTPAYPPNDPAAKPSAAPAAAVAADAREEEDDEAVIERPKKAEPAAAIPAATAPAAEAPAAPAGPLEFPGEFDLILAPLPLYETRALEDMTPQRMSSSARARVNDVLVRIAKPLPRNKTAAGQAVLIVGPTFAEQQRAQDIGVLGVYNAPVVTASLFKLVTKQTPYVRKRIPLVMARHNTPEAASMLTAWLASPKLGEKLFVRLAMTQMTGREAITWLAKKAMRSSQPRVRIAAIEAVAGTDLRGADEALIARLRDNDGEVRAYAALGLGRRRTAAAAAELMRLLKDRDFRAQSAALMALGSLRHAPAKAGMVEALLHRKPFVRRAAIRALTALRTKDVIDPLIKALEREPSMLKETAVEGLTLVTGKTLNINPGSWQKWWASNRDTFTLPPLAAAAEAFVKARNDEVEYYGIQTNSRRIIFVVDVSGSMAGVKIGRMQKELTDAIREFTPEHWFNIIQFHTGVKSWRKGLNQCLPQNKSNALKFVEGLVAAGGTNIHDALMLAFQDPYVDTIFFLSDGAPSIGKVIDPGEILLKTLERNKWAGLTIHTIGIGEHDPLFMQLLAESNHGTYVAPDMAPGQ